MHLAVVGLSHRTAPVAVREKLSIPEQQVEAAIQQLKSYPHIEEVAILSTCNRLEIYCVTRATEPGVREITQFLSEHSHLPLAELRPHLFVLLHQDAVMHLMRVAAGLDSLVLGEGQILSQVKTMYKLGQQYEGVGRILNRLLKQAVTAGKRVRTETSIGTGAVSISSAAVELAQLKVMARGDRSDGNLAGQRVLILGAGKMSRLLVQHLIAKGADTIQILNRTLGRAEELAKQYGGDLQIQVGLLSGLMGAIVEADIVFTSTSATDPILDRAKLEMVLAPEQQLMLIDIAVPRNVAADVVELAAVESYNVDDLREVVAQNQESRRKLAEEAEALLEEEVDAFDNWWQSLDTVPTINCLRDKIEMIREQELEKALSRLGTEFGDKHQAVVEALTRGIVNKILHDPMVQLRSQQDIEARRRAVDALQMLFNLDPQEQLSS
ncbi:glutamyl-tRNA reductase [Synechococcus elongatus IITB4]|uniref:glutamyl-tRNA reductase n=1 Tax=Synechococcus elongatus TaxID=32046 RepID=UPI0030D10F23